jgi:predicted Zn-dependent protease
VAWSCRGQVYRIAGLHKEAIGSFERAIRMSPVDRRLHLMLASMGQALIELGRLGRGCRRREESPSSLVSRFRFSPSRT